MKTIKYFTMAFAALLTVACNQETPEDYGFYSLQAGPEQEVLINYAANTLMSIRLADIARQNAGSEELRKFAVQLSDDHRQIYAALEKLAAEKGMKLPQRFVQKQVDIIQMMRSKEGAAFDKEYIHAVAGYHGTFRNKMEEIMRETPHQEVLDFARLVDASLFIHQNRLKSLKAGANA